MIFNKIATLFVCIILAQVTCAQQTIEWLKMLEHPKDASYRLINRNELASYSKFDFSSLMLPKNEFLGFIEPSYQRLSVYFDEVTKSKSDQLVYHVKGASVVKKNRCDFSGWIKITQIREYRTLHYGVDDEYKTTGINKEGILVGTFRFEEDRSQNHVGVFEGVMTLNWYLDRNGKVHYDNIEMESDTYRNNQYLSTWTQYGATQGKVANWGENRIPFSGDLDIGADEFSVNPKYLDNGWRDP